MEPCSRRARARLSKAGVVGQQRAAFAAGAEVFAGIKTEAGNFAERADDFALVFCAVRLGGVFDERQLVFAANRQDRIEVERMAVEMHRHDGLGARRDGAFDQLGVEIEDGVVNIHKDRFRADVGNRPARGDEREGRGDDLVARADAEQQHGHVQRRGAAVESGTVFRADEFGEVLFKLRHVGAEAKGAVVNGPRNGGVQFFAERAQLRHQVEIGNFVVHFGAENNPVARQLTIQIFHGVCGGGLRPSQFGLWRRRCS